MFACIRDCSVCPFSCNRKYIQKKLTRNSTNQLPEGLKDFNNFQQKTGEFAEKLEKISEFESKFTENTQNPLEFPQKPVKDDEKSQNFENLPVLSDIQYEIKNVKKRNLFDFLRGRK